MQSAILEKIEARSFPRKREDYYPDHNMITSQIPYDGYLECVKKRSTLDVVLIDQHGHILFVSHGEASILRLLENEGKTAEEHEAQFQLTQILNDLQVTVFSQMKRADFNPAQEGAKAFFSFRGQAVSLLAQRLKGTAGTADFVMIFIEPLQGEIRSTAVNQSLLKFTPREESVVHYVKKGFTNKEIAGVLNIGVYTVKDHVKRIMKKVNVHTRTGIVGKLEEPLAI